MPKPMRSALSLILALLPFTAAPPAQAQSITTVRVGIVAPIRVDFTRPGGLPGFARTLGERSDKDPFADAPAPRSHKRRPR